jgi:hypothetical protein
MSLQKSCEVLEELVQRETRNNSFLSMKEFLALNRVLLELTVNGEYDIPDKYLIKPNTKFKMEENGNLERVTVDEDEELQ